MRSPFPQILAALFEPAPFGVFAIDQEGVIVSVNYGFIQKRSDIRRSGNRPPPTTLLKGCLYLKAARSAVSSR